jgi:hypothetical protein
VWICLYALFVLASVQVSGAAEPITWTQLCSILEVRRDSEAFRQFCGEYGLQPFGKRDGNYSGREGIYVNCLGDKIIYVGVHVSESRIDLPFGLGKSDDLVSATRKLGFSPSKIQQEKAQEFLDLVIPTHQIALQFVAGRLSRVGASRANKPPLPIPASDTPAADAPAAPPGGAGHS